MLPHRLRANWLTAFFAIPALALLIAVLALTTNESGYAQQPGTPTVNIYVPDAEHSIFTPTPSPTVPPGSTATSTATPVPTYTPTATVPPGSTATPTATVTGTPKPTGDDEEFNRDQRADLTAQGFATSPEFPMPGEAVTITVTILNHTANPAEKVTVRLAEGDTPLGETKIDIEAGVTGDAVFSWTAGAAGTHTLSASVEAPEDQEEFNTFDNIVTGDIVVAGAPPAGAEFAVTGLELVTPLDAPPYVQVAVTNSGTASGSAPVRVLIGGLPAGSGLIGPVGPGISTTFTLPWRAGQPPAVISAEVNPRFGASEANPSDNVSTYDSRPAVDLRVVDLSVSAENFQEGRPRQVTISGRIENDGQFNIAVNFNTSIMPGTITGSTPEVYEFTAAGLAAGQSIDFSRTISTPESDFTVRAATDTGNAVTEDDESNNVAYATYENPTPNQDRWVSIGPRIDSAHDIGVLCQFAISPASTIYTGCFSSGLWMKNSSGWQPIADSLPTLQVAALAIDPTNANIIYLGTANNGLYRSLDGGNTWAAMTTVNLRIPSTLAELYVDPNSPNRLLLSTLDGVKRSLDSGANWTTVLPAGTGGTASGLVQDPANPATYYAAISNPSDNDIAGIFRSTDSGLTWGKLTGCPGASLPPSFAGDRKRISLTMSGSKIYVGIANRPESGSTYTLLRTTNIGCSIGGRIESGWETTGFVPDNAAELWSGLWADPNNASIVYLGGTKLLRSTSSGSGFSAVSGVHADHHRVAFDPNSPGTVYDLNDGGIFRSTDSGGNFSQFGEGLLNFEFYDIANAPTDPNLVIGGTQDNGTEKYISPNTVWTHYQGGDGATVDIDPTNAQILYQMYQYASSITRSTDQGASGTKGIAAGLPDGAVCFNLHFQVHPKIPTTMLASCQGSLWRTTTTEPPGAWSILFTPPTGGIVRSTVDGTIDRYYAGANNGRIYAATSGANFTTVFTQPYSMGVTDMEVDLDSPTVLYASFGGSNLGRIYRLQRNESSFAPMTAQDITSNLPTNITVQTIGIDRNAPLTIYAGTNKGVYRGRSADDGATWIWTSYSNGMPQATDVRDLEVHPSSGVIRAGTFGRGAYEVLTGPAIGSLGGVIGHITLLRVHDMGTGYGPPLDFLDDEVIVWLDTEPGKAYGFKLRIGPTGDDVNPGDPDAFAEKGMLKLVRDAFNKNKLVRFDYIRTGLRNNHIIRVMELP